MSCDQLMDYLCSSLGLNVSYVQTVIDNQIQLETKEKILQQLKGEGIEMKQNFNLEIYVCKVCDECFQTADLAVAHTSSGQHTDNKSGNFPDDLDKSLCIPTDRLSDISVVLARKEELKKMDIRTKYQYRRHGIRIKDGIGCEAYVCIVCNLTFRSVGYVRQHLKKTEPNYEEEEFVYSTIIYEMLQNSSARASEPYVPRLPPLPVISSAVMSTNNNINNSLTPQLSVASTQQTTVSSVPITCVVPTLSSDDTVVLPQKRRRKRGRRRNRNRDKSRDRSHDRSRDKNRDRSGERSRDKSREQTRDQSRERSRDRKVRARSRSRSRSRDRNSRDDRNGRNNRIKESKDFKTQGISINDNKSRSEKYLCIVCNRLLADQTIAQRHIATDEHSYNRRHCKR